MTLLNSCPASCLSIYQSISNYYFVYLLQLKPVFSKNPEYLLKILNENVKNYILYNFASNF